MSNIEIRRDADTTVVRVDGKDMAPGLASLSLHMGPDHALLTIQPGIFLTRTGELLGVYLDADVVIADETKAALMWLGWTPPAAGAQG